MEVGKEPCEEKRQWRLLQYFHVRCYCLATHISHTCIAVVPRVVLGFSARSRLPRDSFFSLPSLLDLQLEAWCFTHIPIFHVKLRPSAMVAIYAAFVSLLLSHVAHAAPTSSLDSSSFLINGKAAQALNAAFANISSTDSCIG